MNIVKLILGAIGLVFVGMLFLWALGWIGTLLGWAFWLGLIGLIGLIGYGGYKLFLKVERKALGAEKHDGLGTGDVQMSWDEYDRKYLHK